MAENAQETGERSAAEGNVSAGRAARSSRRRMRWLLLIAGPAIVIVVGGYIYLNSGRYAETDNAYIKADTVAISASVGGPIVHVAVAENQRVTAGQVLFKIRAENFQNARDQAAAQMEAVHSFIEGMTASYRQALEELALARTNVLYAERRVAREQALTERRLGSESDLDDAQHGLDIARRQIPIIEQHLAQLQSQLGGDSHLSIENHAAYRTAKAAFDSAELELAWTTVVAPIDGIVSHVPLTGTYAAPGVPVMTIVATDNLWVEANFKETQLAHVAVGQPVVVRIDTYKGQDWQGRVDSISPATGAVFSVIPAQNASGNWVKVAQRIPVRIRLDHVDDSYVLRAGMSATVEIDTGYERKAPLFLGFLQN